MRSAWKISGWYLFTIGIIHTLFAFVTLIGAWRNEELMSQIEKAFDLQTTGSSPQQFYLSLFFWFIFLGFFWMYIGLQWQRQIKQYQEPLSKFTAWGLTMLTIAGLIFVPASGFWLVLPLCFIMLCPHYLKNKTATK